MQFPPQQEGRKQGILESWQMERLNQTSKMRINLFNRQWYVSITKTILSTNLDMVLHRERRREYFKTRVSRDPSCSFSWFGCSLAVTQLVWERERWWTHDFIQRQQRTSLLILEDPCHPPTVQVTKYETKIRTRQVLLQRLRMCDMVYEKNGRIDNRAQHLVRSVQHSSISVYSLCIYFELKSKGGHDGTRVSLNLLRKKEGYFCLWATHSTHFLHLICLSNTSYYPSLESNKWCEKHSMWLPVDYVVVVYTEEGQRETVSQSFPFPLKKTISRVISDLFSLWLLFSFL